MSNDILKMIQRIQLDAFGKHDRKFNISPEVEGFLQ